MLSNFKIQILFHLMVKKYFFLLLCLKVICNWGRVGKSPETECGSGLGADHSGEQGGSQVPELLASLKVVRTLVSFSPASSLLHSLRALLHFCSSLILSCRNYLQVKPEALNLLIPFVLSHPGFTLRCVACAFISDRLYQVI